MYYKRYNGGAGSGNWGHKGRPGKIGGSGKGGNDPERIKYGRRLRQLAEVFGADNVSKKYKEEFNKKMKTIRNSNNIIKKIKKTANKTKYRKVINFTNKEYNEPLTDLEREKIKRITGYKLFEKEYENNDNLRESIQYYSNYGYQKINKFLRSKNTSITYKELQAIKEIDKVIDKQNLKENIQVQREFLMENFNNNSINDYIKKNKNTKAYSSTSFINLNFPIYAPGDSIIEENMITEEEFYKELNENTKVNVKTNVYIREEITVPKGKGRGVFINGKSKYPKEEEFLIKKNANFQINLDDKKIYKAECIIDGMKKTRFIISIPKILLDN